MKYWLMKTEPEVYSIDDLQKDGKTYWDGVRNYQARNFMRDQMAKGDMVLFYHSNAEPSGIAGTARIASEKAYPDPSAFDKKDRHYDSASKKENPTWFVVDVAFVKKWPKVLALDQIKRIRGLERMLLLKKGQRLSIQPVTQEEWEILSRHGEAGKH